MIDPALINAAVFIIDSSNMVDQLNHGMLRDRRGRPRDTRALRLLLIGGLLSVMDGGGFVITEIYETLTRKLPLQTQLELGVAELVGRGGDGHTVRMINKSKLDYFSKRLADHLDYGQGSAPDLTDDERARRHSVISSVIDAAFDVFDFDWQSSTYALDATGIWSWGRGNGRPTGQAAHHLPDQPHHPNHEAPLAA